MEFGSVSRGTSDSVCSDVIGMGGVEDNRRSCSASCSSLSDSSISTINVSRTGSNCEGVGVMGLDSLSGKIGMFCDGVSREIGSNI